MPSGELGISTSAAICRPAVRHVHRRLLRGLAQSMELRRYSAVLQEGVGGGLSR